MPNSPSSPEPQRGTSREIFAWAMYDWANSAYSTLSITLLVSYFLKVVFPEDKTGSLGEVVWAWGIGGSMLVAAVLSPILGAVADSHGSKRRWLAATAFSGSASAIVLSFIPSENSWWIVAIFCLMSLMFELSLGFYNGFLPEIADEASMNRVSSWGYGLGYIGGALALLLALAVFEQGEAWGLESLELKLRAGLFILGAWWGLFSLPTVLILHDRHGPSREVLPLHRAVKTAVREVKHTLRNLVSFRALAFFLIGFLFYNDGIQTVISQASPFAERELDFDVENLIGLILMVQFVAMPGSLIVGWLADRWGQKPVLMVCLVIWMSLVVTTYFVQTADQFWILGFVLALVLGGTQSVSRAIMGMMTPKKHAAEFFGFFNLSGKATSFLGTFLFGLVIYWTESARYAIISLLVFFLVGTVLAAFVDVDRGRRDAQKSNGG